MMRVLCRNPLCKALLILKILQYQATLILGISQVSVLRSDFLAETLMASVYDSMATGLEAGRYCETVGWLSMTGIRSRTFFGKMNPAGVPNPTTIAVKPTSSSPTLSSSSTDKVSSTASAGYSRASENATPETTIRYSRRYLDWNRLTFAYHADGSQNNPFDLDRGLVVTNEITMTRTKLNLTALYGCAPITYCQTCKPFGAEGNIYSLLATALAATVINETRKDIPRMIIIHNGNIRFDLVEGPFTYDDSFIVSPFQNGFQFIPDVPYKVASQVLGILVSAHSASSSSVSD
jgi:hypothetical protein